MVIKKRPKKESLISETKLGISGNLNYAYLFGGGQNTDPQSMDYPNGLPKWTTLKWTTPKNTVSDEYYIKKLRFYTYTARTCNIFVPHGLQPPC